MKALQTSPNSRAFGHKCSPTVPQRHTAGRHSHHSAEHSWLVGNRDDSLRAVRAACMRRSGHRLQCRAAAPLQAPLEQTYSKTASKALGINLDPKNYGSFAEIGAGQEVARWFFR